MVYVQHSLRRSSPCLPQPWLHAPGFGKEQGGTNRGARPGGQRRKVVAGGRLERQREKMGAKTGVLDAKDSASIPSPPKR